MERLRLRAARMFEQGTSQAEVAHRLNTSRQNTHRWYHAWQHGGRDALRAAGRAGRKPKLDARARRKIERALLHGALAHGFEGLWANLKDQEFANYAAGTLESLAQTTRDGVGRIRRRPRLLFAFLDRTGLSL